jgi:predicted DNA-binding protein
MYEIPEFLNNNSKKEIEILYRELIKSYHKEIENYKNASSVLKRIERDANKQKGSYEYDLVATNDMLFDMCNDTCKYYNDALSDIKTIMSIADTSINDAKSADDISAAIKSAIADIL